MRYERHDTYGLDAPRQTVPQPQHRFKDCTKCNQHKPPEGGVELSPQRWVCAACWAKRATKARK